MRVKDLIEELQKYDEKEELAFNASIESGRSFNFTVNAEASIELVENYAYRDTESKDEEQIVVLGRRLVISIAGECTGSE